MESQQPTNKPRNESKHQTGLESNGRKPKLKSKRRDKSDLGPNFVPPDGGWAWVVCFAAGFSAFCVFTPVQQYGIIYRQRMYDLGFDAKQITTIINSELATAAVTGIVNGALFRRFSYRQMAIIGGFLIFLGTFLTAFCSSFLQYFTCFSCIYGIGLGMNLSATALAVNTYFKKYRRRATGFSSTLTGLGPILLPHICTFLLKVYGTQGTVLIVAAFALNSVACGSTLQPVLWHVKSSNGKLDPDEDKESAKEKERIKPLCKYCENKKENKKQLSQPTVKDEDIAQAVYEIIDVGTPLMERTNADWFRSRISLEFGNRRRKHLASMESLQDAENIELEKFVTRKEDDEESVQSAESVEGKASESCSCREVGLPQTSKYEGETCFEQKKSLKAKIVSFFDLDLLTDVTFVNIVQGMTIMMFCELNFSFLTPFILASYGYNNEQISLAMSLLAGVDIVVRFCAPFVVERMKFSNKVLFAFGIIVLLIGRMCVVAVSSFRQTLVVFLFMGFGKGFRTIFGPLLIPSYVPLKRLAGASGLQLFLNAIFTMSVGPLLGLIADISSYTFTIHFMNLMTVCSLLLWLIEWLIRGLLKKPARSEEIN